jgi:hypothetical protein
MNRTIRKAGFVFCIFSLFVLATSGCKKAESPAALAPAVNSTSSLHVPFIPQRADEWCWAACTEMVSKYYHDKINSKAPVLLQCDLANILFHGNLKCPVMIGEVPASMDNPTVPFPPLADTSCEGYTFNQTYGSRSSFVENSIAELPWDSLQSVIAHGSPVIFEWGWEGVTIATIDSNSTHYMVAEGIPHSSYINNPGWISVNDPWPTGVGKHSIMTYSEYANHIPTSSPGSKTIVFNAHGVDYYQFTYQGK